MPLKYTSEISGEVLEKVSIEFMHEAEVFFFHLKTVQRQIIDSRRNCRTLMIDIHLCVSLNS